MFFLPPRPANNNLHAFFYTPVLAHSDQQAEALPQHPRRLQQRFQAAVRGVYGAPFPPVWGRGPLHGALGKI